MQVYLDVAVLLNFAVDFLLLVGANRLSGFPAGAKRAALAAALGGIYGAVCLLPGFSFLGNLLWRTVCLAIMAGIAYGIQRSALPRAVLFLLLSMAMGGIALGIGSRSFFGLIAAAVALCGLCVLGFRGKAFGAEYVPVELTGKQGKLCLTALRDTGNTLTDPITGESVLVVGADAAVRLTGLNRAQLQNPVETVTANPTAGLRLIPYHAVGQSGGMLLAMRVEPAKIGNRKGGVLVAFAPGELSSGGVYQALYR